MFAYDAQLLAIASAPAPTSIDGVAGALRAIDGVLPEADGLKWFNSLYLSITEAVRDAIGSRRWNNPAFDEQLDIDFAGRYFSALTRHLEGHDRPKCWRALFDARGAAKVARVQFALAGVNAHINHDLPQALVATCRQFGLRPVHGGPEYDDFTALNAVLESRIDAAKAELKIQLDGGPVPSLGALETQLAAWSVAAARESAWINAEVLAGIQGAPVLAERFLRTLDGWTGVIGKGLLICQ